MVYKIKIKIGPFFKAGILTLLIFLTGIMFGIWIDNFRLSEIRERLSEVDVNWNDAILLAKYFEKFGKDSCDFALQSNLLFNEKIYSEGRKIEDALNKNLFTPELEQELRRYVLLQTQFWFNSMELKEKCGFDYHNVVHLFKQFEVSREEAIINNLQSSIMLELKERCGNKIMLIPLTVDLNLTTTDAILLQYNIKKLPAIIIDEKIIFQGLTSLDQIQEFTNC